MVSRPSESDIKTYFVQGFANQISCLPLLEPVRPSASPRSTPPFTSARLNHVEFDVRMTETETVFLSSGDQSPVRGRALRRMPARDRVHSRSSTQSLSIRSSAIDASALRDRLMSRDLTATPEQYYEESLLEPRPIERFRSCSLSEQLHRVTSLEDVDKLTKFVGHRDTFALLGIQRLHNRAICLPDSFFVIFVRYIDFDTYKALRLLCRFWCHGVTHARPLRLRAPNKLPFEILGCIYDDLEPLDFDAARRTCRTWMIASLKGGLLARKLRAGGWWNSILLDMARLDRGSGREMSITSGNWLLSKRIATECALTGSHNLGLDQPTHEDVSSASQSYSVRRALSLTSQIDFLELAQTKGQIERGDPPLRFDVSMCQRYLLVTKVHTIYVYALFDPYNNPPHEYGGFMKAMNVIRCPQQVLAVSMDTSFDRLSVAALLGDRLGMVFELQGDYSEFTSPAAINGRGRSEGSVPVTDLIAYNADGSYGMQSLSQQPDSLRATFEKRSVYKHVCSAQDPPQSVAICPQRRCVAFGNTTGIEVHWIDALSGRDLQRWFPLSSSCDCLYFFPNRIGLDSARKLRIITSAAHPTQKQISACQHPSRHERLNKKGPWDDFTDEDQAWKLNWAFSRMSPARSAQNVPEHYNARPLSDGNALLFTYPPTNELVLGGGKLDQGMPYLTRRFVLDGPAVGWVPYVYTAANELRWGVRVLAGFANEKDIHSLKQLWFFSVPPDHFFADESDPSSDEDSPIPIRGIYVASIPGLSEVAVDATDGDLTLRAFSPENGGKMSTWQLAVDKDTIKKIVLEDGMTIPVVTPGSNDIVMEDADGIMTLHMDTDLDGATTPPTQTAVETSTHPLDQAIQDVDTDGDTSMLDAPLLPDPPSPPSPTPPAPLFFNNECFSLSTIHEASDVVEDEGYFSADEGGGHSEFQAAGGVAAVHVPPVHGSWSGSDEWVPQYLAEHGADIEDEGLGVDVLECTRLEMDVVGL